MVDTDGGTCMALLEFDDEPSNRAKIKVIGVGGGGGNAINTMIESRLEGVDFIAANTDIQALESNQAPTKIPLGGALTKGLGAGANPEIGRNAALEDIARITDLITMPGLINVDFADVRTIMKEMGRALMGTGRAVGERRAIEAAQQAISSPLLEDVSITGATGILINITGGPDLTLFEVNEASTLIQEAAHEDANIIFGSVIDANFVDEVRITVIATGFDRVTMHLEDPMAHAPVERKRATQIAMPYTGIPTAARPHVPPTQSPRHEQVEMKTQ